MTAVRSRYSTVAILLHWTIAALIVTNVLIGWQFDGARGMAKFGALQLHKSVGLTVLMLSVLRLAWRLANPPPRYVDPLPRWQHVASSAVHWTFYGIMIGLPLTGWIMVSASPTNIPTLLYKLVSWPHLGFIHDMAMADRKAIAKDANVIHHGLVYLTYGLLGLHVSAALKHQVLDRDAVLARMAPFLKPPRGNAIP